MYRVVHRNEVQCLRRLGRIRVEAVQKHRHVVVPVKKNQRLVARDDERRVNQLGDFRENKQHHPKPRHALAPVAARRSADCVRK